MSNISEQPADKIVIIIKDQHDAKMFFLVRRGDPIRRVLDGFCKRTNIDYRTVTFLYDGSPLRSTKTPMELNMENKDVIDAMLPMLGGGY